jgi:hypothetical protein
MHISLNISLCEIEHKIEKEKEEEGRGRRK